MTDLRDRRRIGIARRAAAGSGQLLRRVPIPGGRRVGRPRPAAPQGPRAAAIARAEPRPRHAPGAAGRCAVAGCRPVGRHPPAAGCGLQCATVVGAERFARPGGAHPARGCLPAGTAGRQHGRREGLRKVAAGRGRLRGPRRHGRQCAARAAALRCTPETCSPRTARPSTSSTTAIASASPRHPLPPHWPATPWTLGRPREALDAARLSVQLDRYQDLAWELLIDLHETSGDSSAAARARQEHARVQAELDVV